MLRFLEAIFFAVIMLCIIGALCLSGAFIYGVVVNGALWVKIVAAAVFALYALIGWANGGDDDGEDQA
ncbi:hypothetical protein PghCCS26_47440 [Paenibacillus glycanilyticus]|uniref:DUF1328 domain-containing protein n=1 Tax=Paenibacillus glycanilyticus TaxID=126569 RepID=A0ABQ6NSX1_9BACL|nr:hypothetical protein [Paenibacillus glycanilyticus]GMK47614.1 hypothetical protein PghCCS26_47440 [Paenibacillus glycanilyticus]